MDLMPDTAPTHDRVVPLLSTNETVLDSLHQYATPSPFCLGKETVLDETYRLAREIRSERLALNVDLLDSQYEILPAISTFCKTSVRGVLYKLNSYVTGEPILVGDS